MSWFFGQFQVGNKLGVGHGSRRLWFDYLSTYGCGEEKQPFSK